MLDELELDTEERIRAFTHPYRMKLLHALKEIGEPATATDLARKLGDGPGKAHYHMRILEGVGIVVLARTESVNGIVARYYEPAAHAFIVKGGALGDGPGAPLRDEVARMISRRFREGLKAFLERTTGTREVGSPVLASAMDEDHFLYDYPIHCDDATWEHIRAQVEAYGKLYGKPAAGTSLRHLFVAGTSDLPDKETAGAARTAAASTRDSRLTERLTATGS
ncbi:MAG: ArsR/SmtB family transcription factor [Clostridia bacterium]|jgi:DNA-binding transcriptional ArsR family regulator